VHRRDWVWYLSGRMVRRYGGFFFQLCCRAANKSWRWRYERDEPASPAIATDGAIEQGVMNEILGRHARAMQDRRADGGGNATPHHAGARPPPTPCRRRLIRPRLLGAREPWLACGCRRYASTGFPGWLISGSGRRHAKPPWLAGTFAGLRAARGTHAATGSASMESAIAYCDWPDIFGGHLVCQVP
jgi:hypothetical protein